MLARKKFKIPDETVVSKIKVDYEKVSSADIMEQIKKEINKQTNLPKEETSTVSEGEKRNAMKYIIRIVFFKLARMFRPLIKILIHEAHQDLMAETHERLNRLEERERDQREKEYIKLLYGLSHNIVVELTKLKIEMEDLRVKLSILEKDFENFKKRERALEKHVFK